MDEKTMEERHASAVRQELQDLKDEALHLGLESEVNDISQLNPRDEKLIPVLRALVKERQERVKAEQERVKAEQERVKAEQERDKTEQLRSGTYFLTIDQVVGTETTPPTVEAENYKALCRNYSPESTAISCRNGVDGNWVDPYKATFEAIGGHPDLSAATAAGQSRRSMDTEVKASIWPRSVSRNTSAGELAHLIPAATQGADSYFFVSDFLFGFKEDRSFTDIRRLIHGTRKKKREREEQNKQGNRMQHTGAKHMVPNFVRLANQKDYFDKFPCVLLLPICDLPFVKNWRGEGYSALMLIDKWDNTDLQDVAGQVLFQDEGDVAENGDLKTALNLFRAYANGIVHAVGNRKPQGIDFEYEFQTFRSPKLQCLNREGKVRKIEFVNLGAESGHPAPDPILLVCKSTVVWARRKGWKLAAFAEADDDDSWDTFRDVAAQNFLQRRKERAREQLIGLEVVIG